MNCMGQAVTIAEKSVRGNLLPVYSDPSGLNRVFIVLCRVGSEFLGENVQNGASKPSLRQKSTADFLPACSSFHVDKCTVSRIAYHCEFRTPFRHSTVCIPFVVSYDCRSTRWVFASFYT